MQRDLKGGDQAMGNMNRMDTDSTNWLNSGSKHNGPICEFLSTLPPNSTLSEILVDDVPFTVTAFINLNTDTNLAYFTSITGTTLIVDCDSISQVIF